MPDANDANVSNGEPPTANAQGASGSSGVTDQSKASSSMGPGDHTDVATGTVAGPPSGAGKQTTATPETGGSGSNNTNIETGAGVGTAIGGSKATGNQTGTDKETGANGPGTPKVTPEPPEPPNAPVPNLVGFSQRAAENALRLAGLAPGDVKRIENAQIAPGAIISTNPGAGTSVPPKTSVNLDVSRKGFDWTLLIPLIPTLAFAFIGGGLIIVLLTQMTSQSISNVAKVENARALITLLIAITTVGIALILSLSTILLSGTNDDLDKRFDRGKQVLATMIGVLGTIVGFYFGSATQQTTNAGTQSSALEITMPSLAPGQTNQAYNATLTASGGTPPYTWSVDDKSLPAELKLDGKTGIISGTPKVQGANKPKFTVTDSAKPPKTETKELPLEIK